jgi:arabinofuranan 3-O-arabinosyltransferase
VRGLLVRAQGALLAGDRDAWRGAIGALGVDTVIVRHDLRPASFDLPVSADPDALDRALAGIGNVRPNGRFGVASLYRVTGIAGVAATGTRLTGVHGEDASSVADTVAGLPPGEVGVTDPGQPVAAFRGTVVDPAAMPFNLAAGGPFRIERTGPDASYRATVTGHRLTLTDADTVAVDGRVLPGRPSLGFTVAGPDVVGLGVGGELRDLSAGNDVVTVGPDTTLTAYAPEPGDGLAGPFRRAADCGGRLDREPDGNPLRVAVTAGVRCAVAPVRPAGGATYWVRFSFREAGVKAQLCLWQDGPAECAPLPAPPVAADWTRYAAITRLAPDVLSARLYLYADAGAGPGAAEFRDVTVTPLRPVGAVTVTPVPAPAADLTLAAGPHAVTVHRQRLQATDRGPEFTRCGSLAGALPRYPTGNRTRRSPDGSVVLDAPVVSTCVETAETPVVAGATYRLSADYVTWFGQTPKICVREEPSGRCAQTPPLARVNAWRTVRTVVRPLPGTRAIRPQLQENGTSMVGGRVSFRGFALTRVSSVSVHVTPVAPPPAPAPAVDTARTSAAEYRVGVHGAAGRFNLALAETYAPGWVIDGLPAGWSARHLTVDGYRNGWVVDGTGDTVLTLRYRPARWAFAALLLSLLGGPLAVALGFAWRAVRSRRRRTREGDTCPA